VLVPRKPANVCRFALCLALLGVAVAADAHPHVWIDTVATFVFAQGKVSSLRLEWAFDEDFSATLLHTVHAPKRPGPLDAQQVKQLYEKDFANLKNDQYFVHLYAGGRRVPIRDVADFSAAYRDRRIIYEFTVRLPTPVDPVATAVALSVYDETYFVEINFAERTPVRFVGGPDPPCRYGIVEDRQHPIYFGMVFPPQLRLDCRRG
jgi:ABC-type uncharacterized transport system substrate-binding protein